MVSPHKGQWCGAFMFSFICAWKRLSKQSRCRWFETPWHSLWRQWRHFNLHILIYAYINAVLSQILTGFWKIFYELNYYDTGLYFCACIFMYMTHRSILTWSVNIYIYIYTNASSVPSVWRDYARCKYTFPSFQTSRSTKGYWKRHSRSDTYQILAVHTGRVNACVLCQLILMLFAFFFSAVFINMVTMEYGNNKRRPTPNALSPKQICRHFADDIFKYIFLNGNVRI